MKLVAVQYYVDSIKYNYYTIVCEKDGIYFIASYRMTNNGGLKYVASIEGDVFDILCYSSLEEAVCFGGNEYMPPKQKDLETHKQLLLYCEQVFNNNKENILKKFKRRYN